ncbi:MAG TPA: hypothetical protein VGN34_19725 [Ktedonobacteraceae bacterium]|jgi:uncharacterized Zn finger protein
MSPPSLTEAIIHQYASPESFQRGYEYYQHGAVLSLVKRGMMFQAEVEGSEYLPYIVHCIFEADGTITATCSCPYDWGGWCKHIVATTLAMIHQPKIIEERPMLKDLLSGLDREQLQALLLKLAEREPALTNVIEDLVGLPEPISPQVTASPATASPRRVQVDAKAVRRQVRSILHSLDRMSSSEAYWQVSAVVNEVRQLLEQGWALIQADDGRNALSLLDAITETYVSDWTNLDDSDGEAGGFFHDLGPIWTEALLSADLSSKERKEWANKLEIWQQEIDDYGVEEVFEVAQEAALRGWDDPQLQRILQGAQSESDSWDGEAPELTVARLHVLERRGRLQEYLHLARAQGQNEAYVAMLVRLGRTQEAAAYGRTHLETAQEALTLARALYDRGERELGLHIAEEGLLLQRPRASLAKWLRDEAATVGEGTRALTAAEVAFREELSLANYLRVAEIAGEQWPERRANLLEYVRHTKSYVPQGQVDVFLHEGLIDDAIAAVEPNATHTLVERVVDAAMQSHPAWVIKVCRQQAEPFMDEGKAQYYHTAANWLAKARTAYRNMGREEEWRTYLSELLDRHRRKYKLVPMLEALRR